MIGFLGQYLTLSWRMPLSYINQSIDLQSISMDWFIYNNGLRRERVNEQTALTISSTQLHYKYLTGFLMQF